MKWLRRLWAFHFEKHVTMYPPEGHSCNCPVCSHDVEAITICRHDNLAYLHPCDHGLSFDAMSRMIHA